MSIISKLMPARSPRTSDSKKIIYTYVIILIILVLCQLFTYNDFIKLLESFWLPGGDATAMILGSIIVICELFALPFLLQMKLSSLMRTVSMVLGWIVPLIWIILTLWINLTVNAISNVGFLGTVVRLMPGWWAVFVSVAMGIMAIWSSWGLWPFALRGKK